MLPQPNRLPAFEIPRVMKHGKRVTGNGITLLLDNRTTDNETDVSRFCFIVSTKLDKRATVRNRIRRLMSESVRLSMDSIKSGFDCIVVARGNMVDMAQREAEALIVNVFHKAGLIE